MIVQSIMASQMQKQLESEPLPEPTTIDWQAATTGNYNTISVSKNITFSPTSVTDSYNHHAHIIEFNNEIHINYSTADGDEEMPGQYVRYQKSTDGGATFTAPSILLQSQDDMSKGWTQFGRVCIPAGFAIYNNELYGVVDINDKGGSNSSRVGVGVIAIKINNDGTFGTPVWIENVDGTFTAPSPITGYPSYFFSETLRTGIRQYYSIKENTPTWYFSVPVDDVLRSRGSFDGNEISEPSVYKLKNNRHLKLWRLLVGGANRKVAQIENDQGIYDNPFLTDIPDYPSRTKILRLSADRFVVIGNNDNSVRSPLFAAFSHDGLIFKSENIYDLDTYTTAPVYDGIYKDIGVQYPDCFELSNGDLFVVYSRNKEDIVVLNLSIPTLL